MSWDNQLPWDKYKRVQLFYNDRILACLLVCTNQLYAMHSWELKEICELVKNLAIGEHSQYYNPVMTKSCVEKENGRSILRQNPRASNKRQNEQAKIRALYDRRVFRLEWSKRHEKVSVWCIWRVASWSKIDIGYVGHSNKKFPIDTNDDLRRAFASGSVHAGKCPVFFMVPSDEDLTQSGNVNATIYSMYIYLDMNKS